MLYFINMRKGKIFYGSLLCGSLLVMSACVDDKYDLDDIDTSTAIKLDNLVVPVNLESIYLDQVLKVDDDDPSNPIIIYNEDGKNKYAIHKGGEFIADPLFLRLLEATSFATINAFPVPLSGNQMEAFSTDYEYVIGAGKVDNSIVRIYKMGISVPMEIDLQFYYNASNGIPEISNLVLSIPDSFTAFYNGNEFTNGEVAVNIVNGKLDNPILVYAIDFENGIEPIGEEGARSLIFSGKIGIKSGNVLSSTENLMANFSMSPFTANEISGEINYQIEAPEFEGVSLEDLPDFLRDGDSKLIIQNPQLYLNFGNPTTADFYTSLIIEPVGNGGETLNFQMDGFKESVILATDFNNLAYANDYPGAMWIDDYEVKTKFPYILYGEGLPEYINFSLGTTYVRGDVLNLTLGENLNVGGKYTFFTPLAFEATSQIIYQKSETDFFGDDMEAVNVTNLQLSAYPSTNLPFDLELIVYPLDKDGNHIYSNGKVVSASGFVKANANGSEILDINLNTPFSGLDGVEYQVKAEFMNDEALSPDQYIKLDKIRAKVTGEYVTKL